MKTQTKRAIKWLFHLCFILVATAFFVAANIYHFINQDTHVPSTLAWLIERLISIKSFVLLPALIVGLTVLWLFWEGDWRKGRRLFACVRILVSFLIGKFYTVGSFLIGWQIASLYVDYIKSFPRGTVYGLLSILLGLLLTWASQYGHYSAYRLRRDVLR